MSLIDIDSRNEDRGSPMPNGHDLLDVDSLKKHRTHSINYVTDATNQAAVLGAYNGQLTIVKSDVFYTPAQVDFNQPNVDGAFYSGATLIGTVAHGLTYIPGVQAYVDDGLTEFFPLPDLDMFATFGAGHAPTFTGGVWHTLRVDVDTTNIYFYYDFMTIGSGTSLSGSQAIKYFLFQQTSN